MPDMQKVPPLTGLQPELSFYPFENLSIFT